MNPLWRMPSEQKERDLLMLVSDLLREDLLYCEQTMGGVTSDCTCRVCRWATEAREAASLLETSTDLALAAKALLDLLCDKTDDYEVSAGCIRARLEAGHVGSATPAAVHGGGDIQSRPLAPETERLPPFLPFIVCAYCGVAAAGPTEMHEHVKGCAKSPWPAALAAARGERTR